MLRFKILVSAVPLMVAAVFARGELLPGHRPCIAIGDASLQIASMPWHADLHVAFTDDPAAANCAGADRRERGGRRFRRRR